MADRQDYTYRRPDEGNNFYRGSDNSSGGGDFGSWILILIFMMVLPPVGLLLLFRKLMGYSNRKHFRTKRAAGQHPYDVRQESRQQQSWTQTGSTAQSATRRSQNSASAAPKQNKQAQKTGGYTPPEHMKAKVKQFQKVPTGRGLVIGGGITAGVFGMSLVAALLDSISIGSVREDLAGFFVLFVFFATGMVLLSSGIARGRKGKRFRKYLSVIGSRELISVRELSQKTGIRVKKVRDDLQCMLDMGMFPQGYLDLSVDMLVLTDDATVPQEETQTPEQAKDDQSALQEIRQLNDAIEDEEMSRKIDRIGEITAKILDYQRKNPGKDSQLRSFLNYYLPTTLKILHAYAQLESQGIEGQNISSAKERIEGMMDKVVEGFEKQLDMLFQNDAMDITSDVSVLEQMLKKDGLSGGQNMTLGG
ncbi:MAG: hypothetical protein H6Q60_423 [Oscillospiraceae bacterium]|nr:hypothetical protein [Oscillospiraceae bacterium]